MISTDPGTITTIQGVGFPFRKPSLFHSASKRMYWDNYDVDQCINLSLSNMIWIESMVIAASHFWLDTLNAFVFDHGLMTPTLVDFLMLTGLNIFAPQSFSHFMAKHYHILETKKVRGWKGYIHHHSRTGPISDRGQTTFLTMWLEKFIFCGKNVSPITNMQRIAKLLASGNEVPLDQHLLGSVHSLLH